MYFKKLEFFRKWLISLINLFSPPRNFSVFDGGYFVIYEEMKLALIAPVNKLFKLLILICTRIYGDALYRYKLWVKNGNSDVRQDSPTYTLTVKL